MTRRSTTSPRVATPRTDSLLGALSRKTVSAIGGTPVYFSLLGSCTPVPVRSLLLNQMSFRAADEVCNSQNSHGKRRPDLCI